MTPLQAQGAAYAPALDVNKIMKILPHRYPSCWWTGFYPLNVEIGDRHQECHRKRTFFQGLWPNIPVMPGVLIIGHGPQVAACGIRRQRGTQRRWLS